MIPRTSMRLIRDLTAINLRKNLILQQRFELTGKMKDFYDIYYLARTFDFEGAKLRAAIFETLKKRETPYDRDSFKRILALSEDEDIQKRWRYFLKNIKDDTLEFEVVIAEIQTLR